MPNKNQVDIKDLSVSLFFLAFCLVGIGLIGLNSISQQNNSNILNSPFYKQVIILIPSIIISFLVLYIPKYNIHKYVYILYLFGIIIIWLF